MELENSNRDRSLQIWDAIRAFFLAAAAPFRDSVAMLVLIHVYQATDWQKTSLSLLLQGGLFLSIPLIGWVRALKLSISSALSVIYVFCAILSLLLALTDSVLIFIIGGGGILLFSIAAHPLLIQLYSLYPATHRGRKTSTSFVAATSGAIFFGYLFSIIIGEDLNQYVVVLFLLTATNVVAALCARKLPDCSLPSVGVRSRFGFKSLELLSKDKLFRNIIIAWFFLGFSNHWLLMYRTNYFVEERFGFSYSPSDALFLVVILPAVLEIVSYYFFGRLFDGMNFIKLRILLNFVHAAYLILVFFGTGWNSHILGMVCFGLHRGGGKIVWNLWVTRISSKETVADYMAVHSFFTGVRMILGPMIGLYSLVYVGPEICTIIALLMVIISIFLFLQVSKHPRIV